MGDKFNSYKMKVQLITIIATLVIFWVPETQSDSEIPAGDYYCAQAGTGCGTGKYTCKYTKASAKDPWERVQDNANCDTRWFDRCIWHTDGSFSCYLRAFRNPLKITITGRKKRTPKLVSSVRPPDSVTNGPNFTSPKPVGTAGPLNTLKYTTPAVWSTYLNEKCDALCGEIPPPPGASANPSPGASASRIYPSASRLLGNSVTYSINPRASRGLQASASIDPSSSANIGPGASFSVSIGIVIILIL